MEAEKTIFEYVSYRDFLRDAYQRRKLKDPNLSMDVVGQALGWSDFSTLSKIISGKRKLPLEKVSRVSAFFKLFGNENLFFENLVKWNDFSDSKSEKTCQQLLRRVQKQNVKVYQPVNEAEFYNFVIIRMTLRRFDGPLSAEDLAKLLSKELSGAELRQSLDIMKDKGLIKEKGGLYSVPAECLHSENGNPNPGVRYYHRKMIYKAIQALESPVEKRQFSGRTLCISKDSLADFKAAIHEALDQIADKFSDNRSEDKELYQVNFHAFPLEGMFKIRGEE